MNLTALKTKMMIRPHKPKINFLGDGSMPPVILWAHIECDVKSIITNHYIGQQTPALPPPWIAEMRQSFERLNKNLNNAFNLPTHETEK